MKVKIDDVFRLYSKTIQSAASEYSEEELQELDDLLWMGIQEYLREAALNET